jgi:hypothetical protein
MPTAIGSRCPFARSTHAGLSTLSTLSTEGPGAAATADGTAESASNANAAAARKRRIVINSWKGLRERLVEAAPGSVPGGYNCDFSPLFDNFYPRMQQKYNPRVIEREAQDHWAKTDAFRAAESSD